MISSLMNIHATTLRFTLFFRVSVYWFMYSVITSEMRLYDGNWWQPVVIFRWLMMRASLRGNRSKQLIYTARHNSHSSVSRSNSGKRQCLFVCSRACGHLFGGERADRRGGTEAFVADMFRTPHRTPLSVADALFVTCFF